MDIRVRLTALLATLLYPHMNKLLFALLLGACSAAELAERVLKTLEGRLSTELPLDTARVTLNGGAQYSAIPRQDGSFKLHAVPPGTYLLEVMDTVSVWPTVRIEVSATAPGKARAHLTHSRQPLPFPLPLEPLVAKPTFFEKREGFQWSQMLMNPMVIMMGFTVMIMFVMPKMMANMDPEQLKEMQSMQSGGMMEMLTNPEAARARLER